MQCLQTDLAFLDDVDVAAELHRASCQGFKKLLGQVGAHLCGARQRAAGTPHDVGQRHPERNVGHVAVLAL